MRVGLDTNVLLRLFERDHPQHAIAQAAIEGLVRRDDDAFVSMQVLTELWSAMTRPRENNGLGWNIATAAARIDDALSAHQFLPDTVEVAGIWLDLVKSHSVVGKKVHDARLAAWALAHRLDELVTFNGQDFKRFGMPARDPATFPRS